GAGRVPFPSARQGTRPVPVAQHVTVPDGPRPAHRNRKPPRQPPHAPARPAERPGHSSAPRPRTFRSLSRPGGGDACREASLTPGARAFDTAVDTGRAGKAGTGPGPGRLPSAGPGRAQPARGALPYSRASPCGRRYFSSLSRSRQDSVSVPSPKRYHTAGEFTGPNTFPGTGAASARSRPIWATPSAPTAIPTGTGTPDQRGA